MAQEKRDESNNTKTNKENITEASGKILTIIKQCCKQYYDNNFDNLKGIHIFGKIKIHKIDSTKIEMLN